MIIWPCPENSTNGTLVEIIDLYYYSTDNFCCFLSLDKNWRCMIHLLWGSWIVSTDVPNWPIFRDQVQLEFQRQLKMSCQTEHSALLRWRDLERSNLKHIVLHTLWLLVSGCPLPDPCCHVLLSILICFIWKACQRAIHMLKQ